MVVFIIGILRKFENMVEVILPQLPSDFESLVDPSGKAALIWILGEYGEVYCTPLTPPLTTHTLSSMQSLPNTPYILEEVVNGISEESSSDVKLQLLSAVVKMFFKRPPECQDILGRLLEHAIGINFTFLYRL